MKDRQATVTILMADDDDDDSLLVHDALVESRLPIQLYIVRDGEELMDYLCHRGLYTDISKAPDPVLILLDLNMPKKHGLEVLKEIKTDPKLRRIPVIVLTSSKAEEDIYNTYELGANSFIIKPETFTSLVEVMRTIGKYWLEIVEMPL
ncbi:response regulator [Anabaena cylindrica FACHB-243]|uniref:Response regulator receiver n=1 Tax=Anabaena cylindrica (strain ATCC 27899 / PCC 7122) TaxID=272123 RepID=K9ZK76_ANACC|nr:MULTISPECIES: response regulator [Anabaena]AFZ58957.1 response regulator receiver [Anabaena cylindrica PCC 7122]MBD2420698.1 response regulator [Anabaena cylindrica FACHB-243]MBY5281190.1 response regulator [Anabaena sp. CCAP 1446/1C]MBY5306674.1 response regulator [Anabaena sp. CCAP 1446/1C]MCM2408408.1 response regulator [Anabaena sp. CCAP 1446/1C]